MNCLGTKKDGEPCTKPAGTYGFCHHHDRLTDKQRAFIDEYMVDLNATQAAKRAGYSEATAYAIGPQNLKKLEIRAVIDHRLKTRSMAADEALARLSDMASATVHPFTVVRQGENGQHYATIDLTTPQAQANLHLLKKVKHNAKGGLEIELHDPKDAIIQILKIAGRYVDKIEHSGEVKTTSVEEIATLLGVSLKGIHGDEG